MDKEFEFDPEKSAANADKHGIDFVEAQVLWNVWGVITPLPFSSELRFERVQLVEGRFWTAIFTIRGENIRLISVRRSRKQEIEDYGRKTRDQDQHDHEP